MKIYILIAFIFWLIASLCLVCSVIGLVLFIRADFNTKYWQGSKGASSWYRMGDNLITKLIE